MSFASKITLGAALTTTTAIIGYVHYKQTTDRDKLHEGVIRDIERQQRRKLENTYLLQKQIDLTKQLKEAQSPLDKDTHIQNENAEILKEPNKVNVHKENVEVLKEVQPHQRKRQIEDDKHWEKA
ncbi:protein PET117 homolog, mitochondrial [Teleopsis dalmanni]|uniref:protein PET117 homolog, mitochondrial n=1 Tax=Teleopsis dalmanni TaxID=139649 RepID=UPI0018CFAA0A|nr:protein PET117 homolog, mitochondrial [Teleopsis dalmanni]